MEKRLEVKGQPCPHLSPFSNPILTPPTHPGMLFFKLYNTVQNVRQVWSNTYKRLINWPSTEFCGFWLAQWHHWFLPWYYHRQQPVTSFTFPVQLIVIKSAIPCITSLVNRVFNALCWATVIGCSSPRFKPPPNHLYSNVAVAYRNDDN